MGEVFHATIVKDMLNNEFYLIIEEMTDISTSKICAILCKYFNKKTKSTTTKLQYVTETYDTNFLQNRWR